MIDCMYRVYREQGLLSFWRGNIANVMGSVPALIITLVLKEKINKMFIRARSDQTSLLFVQNFLSGGLAGALTLLLTYPFDFV